MASQGRGQGAPPLARRAPNVRSKAFCAAKNSPIQGKTREMAAVTGFERRLHSRFNRKRL